MNVKAEVLFAMVPEWILESEIQAVSVRVYGILARAANQTSKKTTVGHKKIAERSRCSVATVKRAIAELETIGALLITRRGGKQGELQITNEYLVKMSPPQVTGELGGSDSKHEHEAPQLMDDPVVMGEPVPQVADELPPSSPVSQNQEPVLEPDHQEKTLATASPRDLPFEALCEVCSIDWNELTPSARGPMNKALAQIRGVVGTRVPEEVAAEIRRRARNYWLHFPNSTSLTGSALAKHWPLCGREPVHHGSANQSSRQSAALRAGADAVEAANG